MSGYVRHPVHFGAVASSTALAHSTLCSRSCGGGRLGRCVLPIPAAREGRGLDRREQTGTEVCQGANRRARKAEGATGSGQGGAGNGEGRLVEEHGSERG